jgi:nucleotide-binding universal stress UspA family protein
MQKLLVPTDFSPHSVNGCHYAVELAKATEGEIRLMHVTVRLTAEKGIPGAPIVAPIEAPLLNLEDREEDGQHSLGSLYEELSGLAGEDVKVTTSLKTGDVVDRVLEEADSYEPDLIVMGVTHHTELFRLLIGSVAEELISKTELPILVVPEGHTYKAWETVVFASDFDTKDTQSIVKVRELLFPKKVKFMAVHMVEGESYFKEELTEIRKEMQQHMRDVTWGDEVEVHLVGGMNVIKNLDIFLDKHDADLLVFTTHKRDWFSRLLRPSVTKQMLTVTHTPMLILHA